MSDVMRELRLKSRDNGRLPMQWDKSSNAGFTKGRKPWMRVNDDFREWNVESQVGAEESVLRYWKEMLALRRGRPILSLMRSSRCYRLRGWGGYLCLHYEYCCGWKESPCVAQLLRQTAELCKDGIREMA